MALYKKRLGKKGEDIATEYLKDNGFTILQKNFATSLGEIDIIAKKDNKICFIEVKTRSNEDKGKPYEAVNKRKINHLKSASTLYLLKNSHKECKLSLDTISIVLNKDNSIKKLMYFENIMF